MYKDVEIDLKQLFNNYLTKIWKIVIASIITGVLAVFLIEKIQGEQAYKATALLRISEEFVVDGEDTYEGVLARKTEIIDSVEEIAKMRETIEPVIEELDLDRSYSEMAKNIEITRNGSTDILQIEASSNSEALAPQIVNKLADSIETQATAVFGADYLDVIEHAEEPEDKTADADSFFNKRNVKKMIIISVALFVLFSGIYLVISIYIPRFNNKYDVEAILGLPVIIEGPAKNSKQQMGELARQLAILLDVQENLNNVAVINFASADWNALEAELAEANGAFDLQTAITFIEGSADLSVQMMEYVNTDATIIVLDRTKTNPYDVKAKVDTMNQLGDKFYGVLLV